MPDIPFPAEPQDNSRAAEKVRDFPQSPGVYLMKDAAGLVIYIGKAKNLRARAGSYFLKAAAADSRTAQLVQEIRDIDYLPAESEVDALLMEARLIKDILPKYNRDLRDDKTFPYLEIHTHEDFPRVEITRTPRDRGTRLFGPFINIRGLRGALQVLQKIFKFRTCSLDISEDDPRWRWFRPCLLASIRQCTAPCNLRISKEDYRKSINRLQQFLEGKKKALLSEMRQEMEAASKELRFEEAARLRDEIRLLETLDQRGKLSKHVQPEVFPVDPKKGLAGLQQGAAPGRAAADGRGHRHRPHCRHGDGRQRGAIFRRPAVQAGLSAAADSHGGGSGRFRQHPRGGAAALPAADGRPRRGRLDARRAFDRRRQRPVARRDDGADSLGMRPATVLSLAKREEEVFIAGVDEPLRLSRHSYALRLLQYVRDEAHRFAQHYHHLLRKKSALGE